MVPPPAGRTAAVVLYGSGALKQHWPWRANRQVVGWCVWGLWG